MLFSSDKIFTAFIGALLALALKAIYDWFIEYRRREDIREMIHTDLGAQKYFYLQLADHCERLTREIRKGIDIFPIPQTNLVNTNIFKAFTYRDYFKTFEKDYYQSLVTIYYLIESHSTQLIRNDYDEYLDELQNSTEEQHEEIDNKYSRHFSDLCKRYKGMAGKVDALITAHEREYNIL